MSIFGYHLIFVRTVPSHTTTPPPTPLPLTPLSLPNADAEIRGLSEHTLSSEGLLQKQLFVQVGRSRALSSVQILAK